MTYVVVCLIFAKPEHVQDVRDKLLEIAKIYRSAPNTLVWSVQEDLEKPGDFCVVQKYASKAAEREIHLNSPTYAATSAYLADMVARPWEVRSWEEEE